MGSMINISGEPHPISPHQETINLSFGGSVAKQHYPIRPKRSEENNMTKQQILQQLTGLDIPVFEHNGLACQKGAIDFYMLRENEDQTYTLTTGLFGEINTFKLVGDQLYEV